MDSFSVISIASCSFIRVRKTRLDGFVILVIAGIQKSIEMASRPSHLRLSEQSAEDTRLPQPLGTGQNLGGKFCPLAFSR